MTGLCALLLLPSAHVSSRVLAGPLTEFLVASYWAGFAASLAWGLYVCGCFLGRASQVVALARLRRALALAALIAAVLIAWRPAAAQASATQDITIDDLMWPPTPKLFRPMLGPGIYHIVLPPDADPNELIGPDAIINCDYFPWAIECWFAV